MSKKALICGVNGQDGAYLSQYLLAEGYQVVGSSRDATTNSFHNLRILGIENDVELVSMALNDFRSVYSTVLKSRPCEIYNLAGQSSVGLSFEQPVETMESIVTGTLNLLETIRFCDESIRFYSAGSSECFGDTGGEAAIEETHFFARSPYAVAKSAAHGLVANYREAYGLHASTGILFNHESPLRPERFVTQKIVRSAARISEGSSEILTLGNINIQRDWGWAPEYVIAMQKMLQMKVPDDYIIATGRTVGLKYFIERAFAYFSLDWKEHVSCEDSMRRPTDIGLGMANPDKAHKVLGWKHVNDVDNVVDLMCAAAADLKYKSR